MRYRLLQILLCCVFTQHSLATGSNLDSGKDANTHINEKGVVEINKEGLKAAGITSEILKPTSLPIYLTAPGEVIPNSDLTSLITPRIKAQITHRLVKVGDVVQIGEPLVRLSSVQMSEAQSNLILAHREWIRVKELGKQAVSAKRYQISEVGYQQAFSKLLAYGMTRSQIVAFIKSNSAEKANGEFTLLARRNGTVFSADFVEGQIVLPGNVLYKIVDESSLWVDARLSSDENVNIQKSAPVEVFTSHYTVSGSVLQVHHKLDETTRTRIIRIKVNNPQDKIHPGEFVTCRILVGKTSPVLAVLQTALIRSSDGDESVYVEVKPNHYKAVEVEVVKKIGAWRVIKGLNSGVKIVTKGVFYVHSEALKSGFTTHNH